MATGSHQATAGVALIAAAILLGLLVVVIARRSPRFATWGCGALLVGGGLRPEGPAT